MSTPRSAWAIIAVPEGDEEALAALAPVERSRAKARFDDLLALAAKAPKSETGVIGAMGGYEGESCNNV